MNIQVDGPRILFRLGSFTITQTTLSSFVVMLGLILLGWLMGRKLKKRPGGRQVLVEKGVSVLYKMVEENMGRHNLGFTPYIGALMLSSVFGSLISMTGVFRSATADLSTTLTWALMTTALVWYHNIKNQGFFGWLKGFAEPVAVMTPLNIISEISQPISMSFRHFGNIAGGSVLTALIYAALSALSAALLRWIPNTIISAIPLFQVGLPAFLSLYFDLFTGCIQALVFSMLTMVYVGAACPPPEECARLVKKAKKKSLQS